MAAPNAVTLVFSWRYPGQYALTVLAAAVESRAELAGVETVAARSPEALEAAVRDAAGRGRRVLVAWSFYSPSFPDCARELAALRALPDLPPFVALAGGVHATAEASEVARAGFDLVCAGEGELALVALLGRAIAGEPLEDTAGFVRLEAGRVVHNPKPPPVSLDDFPPFAAKARRAGAIELTRGCIYACRFCQTPFAAKARFRHRSLGAVRDAVRVLRGLGKRDVRFITPTALSWGSTDERVRLDAIEALLRGVREAAGADGRVWFGTFPSEVRPEHVSPEALALIARYADNDNLILGGQSGSDRVLEASRRGHRVADVERAVAVCLEGGFVPNVDFILGLPGETPDDLRATVRLMQRLAERGARVHGHTFMPLPGTPYADAPPGAVDPQTALALERLASAGRAYGHWRQQREVAVALAERRARNRAARQG